MRSLLAILCLSVIAYAKLPRPLANIPIQTPDRKSIDLKKYRGKVVMVVLFLTDCPDCIDMVNYAQKLETAYGARGFQVVGAAIDDNAAYQVTPFIQRYRPNFPIGFLDKDDLIKFADIPPNVRPIAPIVMFIDHKGTVRFQYYGADQWMLKDKEKNLRAITSGLINERNTNGTPQRITTPAK